MEEKFQDFGKDEGVFNSRTFISLSELAVIFGKSESSIRYHVRMGRIRPSGKFGRRYVFKLDDVMKDLQRAVRKVR